MLVKTMPESWLENLKQLVLGSMLMNNILQWDDMPTPPRAIEITKLETEMIAKGITRKKNTEHSLGSC